MNVTTYMGDATIAVRSSVTNAGKPFATITVCKREYPYAGFIDLSIDDDELRQLVEQGTHALVKMAEAKANSEESTP